MAEGLLAAEVERHPDRVEISSAGLRVGDGRVPSEVAEAMDACGVHLERGNGRSLTAPMLAGADLIIGMTRRHLKEIVLLESKSWPRAFTYKELVRRGSEVGPRRPDQGFRSWIDAVHGDRDRSLLLDRSDVDDLADPYGGTPARYRATAAELAGLTRALADLLWADGPWAPPA